MSEYSEKYNLSYFLSALGNGGLSVSLFMYLMFMINHSNTPIPTFNHVYSALIASSFTIKILLIVDLAGIVYFAYRHYKLLVWNLKEYSKFKSTQDFNEIKKSSKEVNLMVIPLTLGMTVNVTFVIGAVFIPGLWNYVEYLFPFSLIAFISIGVYGLKIFYAYLSRLIHNGNFDSDNNNSLSQLLPSFAFQMIGVGMAAPGAMSHNLITSSIGIIGAIFFTTLSGVLLINNLVLGLKSIFKYGIRKEDSPSLWIVIPIATLLGITILRIISGISHNMLHSKPPHILVFVIFTLLVSLQIIMGLAGYTVMKKNRYLKEYVYGDKKSVGSLALICPGVATFVLGMFFIHWGIVKTHIVAKYSLWYFVMLIPLVLVQIKTISALNKINRKLFV
ncbi:TsoY family (seleno)protein [Caldisalinibacter kiritimatiensis]|uniref:Voltage-dependent anion channel n=1 Tax=Caldisalinibacter kiritimatiensis TaxID=1304284 RepID=R1AW21_9FIRM|nr:hypothetical protein [Caldisalinibacter kiritimatiensis]EOD00837.1 hypothetical protein L21TH_1113 [Caldisalinibacter kiritimatiensis]